MTFNVRHRRSARAELVACARRFGPAGPNFLAEVQTWLAALADEAERGDQRRSEDASRFLEQWSAISPVSIPKSGFERWLDAGCQKKITAFLAWLRGWLRGRLRPSLGPPLPLWEFRAAMEVFMVPNLASGKPPKSPGVVLALYEVDRVEGQIVVTIYPELPLP